MLVVVPASMLWNGQGNGPLYVLAAIGGLGIRCFFPVSWSIWEARNRKVFKSEEVVISLAIDAVKLKVAWWFKFFSKGSADPITYILLNLKE